MGEKNIFEIYLFYYTLSDISLINFSRKLFEKIIGELLEIYSYIFLNRE